MHPLAVPLTCTQLTTALQHGRLNTAEVARHRAPLLHYSLTASLSSARPHLNRLEIMYSRLSLGTLSNGASRPKWFWKIHDESSVG